MSAARPDLIILDLHLAETATSWSLIGALREHALTASTPIIALMSEPPDRESDQLQLSLWGVQTVFGSDDVMTAVQKTLLSSSLCKAKKYILTWMRIFCDDAATYELESVRFQAASHAESLPFPHSVCTIQPLR